MLGQSCDAAVCRRWRRTNFGSKSRAREFVAGGPRFHLFLFFLFIYTTRPKASARVAHHSMHDAMLSHNACITHTADDLGAGNQLLHAHHVKSGHDPQPGHSPGSTPTPIICLTCTQAHLT
jgi:hypothetical protein